MPCVKRAGANTTRPRQTILPPDLIERYQDMAFWRDLQNCKAYRLVSQPTAAKG